MRYTISEGPLYMGINYLETMRINGAALAGYSKVYVLDTNVLVHDPEAFFNFVDALIAIPAVVLEELDSLKYENTHQGKNTRTVIRKLDELRSTGSLSHGILLNNGSVLKVFFSQECYNDFMFRGALKDNEILHMATALKAQGHDVCFVSRDINARVKADVLGIEAQDYQRNTLEEVGKPYNGWKKVLVPAVELKKDTPGVLKELKEQGLLSINEFVILESQHNPFNYRIFRYLGNSEFKLLKENALGGITIRNQQQAMALDLLLDDSIELVNLIGSAGTGKTFLALLAGLQKVLVKEVYKKMLIARPIVPLGRDIGYLPGTVEEKLRSWMLPIYDNAVVILETFSQGNAPQKMHKHSKNSKKEYTGSAAQGTSLDRLIAQGLLSLEAITYMRGRSISQQFIIIDEAQNLTAHEIKTVISRVGAGSKIVLTGDPQQIDIGHLDTHNNGLIITNERFKGQHLFGSVYLKTSERSKLSQLAGELL